MDSSALDCFRMPGEWLRGNLHSHTTNSDGTASPEELADWYQRNGYDFLAITDHDLITDTKALNAGNMLLIPGVEFGYEPEESPGWILDMLGINLLSLPDVLDPQKTGHVQYDPRISPQQIIDDVNAQGGLAIMCHPYFMINMTEPYLKYNHYIGIEAYNYVCEEICGRGHHEIYWDAMLLRQKKLWGVASDDSHAPEFGHAWIEVKAKERSIPAIIDAIRHGWFYSTTGIQIFDAVFEDGLAKVCFDRPCDVAVIPWAKDGHIVRFYEAECKLVDGRRRFYAEIPVRKDCRYMRIELTDQNGGKAYTNPVFLD